MSRPDLDLDFMRMARLVASRTTCLRRGVGCVLTDSRGRVLATGYNGVPRGMPHCNAMERMPALAVPRYPDACPGALIDGASLDTCLAVHAEQNAILQCEDADAIATIYTTLAPCDSCLKLLQNTNATRLVVGAWWRDNEALVRARWCQQAARSVYLEGRT